MENFDLDIHMSGFIRVLAMAGEKHIELAMKGYLVGLKMLSEHVIAAVQKDPENLLKEMVKLQKELDKYTK